MATNPKTVESVESVEPGAEKARKRQISGTIPEDQYKALEDMRWEKRMSFSAVLSEAIDFYVKAQTQA